MQVTGTMGNNLAFIPADSINAFYQPFFREIIDS